MTLQEQAKLLIEQAEFADLFELADNNVENTTAFSKLKQEFLDGNTNHQFAQRLKTLVNELFPNQEIENSSYDAFNKKLQAFSHNQQAKTSAPLADKNSENLDVDNLQKMFAKKRVQEHFEEYNIKEQDETNTKLRALGLMSNGHLFKGTFLCLADLEQMSHLPDNNVVSKFFSFEDREGDRTEIAEFVRGNLVEQFQQMLRHIKKNLYLIRDIDTRTEDYQIPEKVFTELLANAFIHRSYELDMQTYLVVKMYPDRLVIQNPGRFPDKVDVNNMHTLSTSYPINPKISQIFYLHDWVETAGEGIRRSQKILEEKNMELAIYDQQVDFVSVTLYKKNVNYKKIKQNNLDIKEVNIIIDLMHTLSVDAWNYTIIDVIRQLSKGSESDWYIVNSSSLGDLIGLETVIIQKRIDDLVKLGLLEKNDSNNALKLSSKTEQYYQVYQKFTQELKTIAEQDSETKNLKSQ